MARGVDMSMSDQIADEIGSKGQIPLLDFAFRCVAAVPGFFARGANAMAEGITSACAGVSGVIKDVASRAADFGPSPQAPVMNEKCGRSADFHMGRVPEEKLCKDSVSIAELGDLKLQNIGDQLRQNGFGVNV